MINGSNLYIIFEKTTIQNFNNLLKRKIDLFPHELSVGYYELQENYPKYKYRKASQKH